MLLAERPVRRQVGDPPLGLHQLLVHVVLLPPPRGEAAELVEHLKGKPDDARVWVLKARMDLEAERPVVVEHRVDKLDRT